MSHEPDEGEEYAVEEIVPIPAKCVKCGRNWVGGDAIRAPSLRQCRCLCGAKLKPHPKHPPVIDAETARLGLFGGPHARSTPDDGVGSGRE